MEKIFYDQNNYLEYRSTPWNSKAFGYEINELKTVKYTSKELLHAMLKDFEAVSSGVKATLTRISIDDKTCMHELQKFGYYFAETAFIITMNRINKKDFGKEFKNNLPLSVPEEEDFEQIKNIAKNDFHHGRFHEDPNFDLQASRNKYASWIEEMKEEGKSFLVYKSEGMVLSFLAYQCFDEYVDLILAGSIEGKGMLSYYFWSSFMTYLQNQGHKNIKTMISASNIGIVNLYARLDFKFEQALISMHKFR